MADSLLNIFKEDIGLSNNIVSEKLKHLDYFFGVFSCDLIPRKISIQENFCIVCNLAEHNVKIGHFITVTAIKKKIFYFDSFGFPPYNPYVIDFLTESSRHDRDIFINTQTIQSADSNHCGFYAILSILLYHYPEYCKNINFSSDLFENDELCKKYVSDMMIINRNR